MQKNLETENFKMIIFMKLVTGRYNVRMSIYTYGGGVWIYYFSNCEVLDLVLWTMGTEEKLYDK